MKVYVIDNGGQWTHREWRVLKYLGVDTRIVPNSTPLDKLSDADGLILSGGSPSVATDTQRMGINGDYLDNADVPILGICAGMQFMANHLGGSTGAADVPEFGKVTLKIMEESRLFEGLPEQFTVWASHNDEVKSIPDDFNVIASSEACRVQAMQHKKLPFYGVQFHPEVENTDFGMDIFKNFLKIIG